MPTPLDRALQSKSAFWGFAGIVGVVSAWAIWGGDMFPQEQQLRQRPSSSQPRQKSKTEPATEPAQDIEAVLEARGDPQTWTEEQLIVWLKEHRNTQPSGKETREELLAMVESALHTPEAGVGGWRD